ncbi:enoyl-CoA hydratase/isomerase family protein [Mycolicibacterium phlei]
MTLAQQYRLDTGTDTVLAEVSGGVGIITLNRPERRNALHADMYEAVPRLLDRFATDDGVGCVLITGAGDAFCAGGDVRDGGSSNVVADTGDEEIAARTAILADNARMVPLIYDLPKVTIAALPGAAVGAGMSIALAADLRIAARSARFIPGWSRLAFSGDFGGSWLLTQLVGPSRALELLVADRPVGADELERLGLVNRVVDDTELATAARAWAAAVAAGPSSAFAGTKANIRDALRLSLQEAIPPESERMVRSALTQEHRDAVRAWLAAAKKRRS